MINSLKDSYCSIQQCDWWTVTCIRQSSSIKVKTSKVNRFGNNIFSLDLLNENVFKSFNFFHIKRIWLYNILRLSISLEMSAIIT
ncbi:hypothetical protein V1477_001080 [Vespula maculifrons]|uniref:Uncharacterized protein n=1 Tax=Vespula maculifrons TaxID=7453 RepID=A0ABD2D0W7_VESMC